MSFGLVGARIGGLKGLIVLDKLPPRFELEIGPALAAEVRYLLKALVCLVLLAIPAGVMLLLAIF